MNLWFFWKGPGVRTFELIAIEPVAFLGVLEGVEIPVGVSFGRMSQKSSIASERKLHIINKLKQR